MVSSGMLRHVALVRNGVSEELSASFIRVTRIGELGTTLAVTSNLRTLCWFHVTASFVPSTPILVTLMKEELSSSETSVLNEPHGVTSQKTPFFIVTAVKISNLTRVIYSHKKHPSLSQFFQSGNKDISLMQEISIT
jgi:hypothetical protein